jgi:PAS domain S-box-containing protein
VSGTDGDDPGDILDAQTRLELLESVGSGIWVYDGQDVLYVNRAMEVLTGYNRQEMLQPGFFERLIHPDDRDMIVERGQARVRGETVPEDYEVRILALNGEVRTLAIHGRRAQIDGRWVSVVSAVDVSELREARRSVREGAAQLRALLNAVPATIIVTNERGKPAFVNRHWLEFTGQPLEEAMQHGTAPLIHPDDLEDAARRWVEAQRDRIAYEIEYRIRDRHGDYRWQLFRIRPVISEEGHLFGWTSVSIDVEETRELREQLQLTIDQLASAIRAKDEVLGLISHELRTPLTTILGNAAYLFRHSGRVSAEEVAEFAAELQRDGRRLYTLIENMLVLSRLGAGETIDTEPVRVNHLVNEVVAEFSERVPARPVTVTMGDSLRLGLANPSYFKQTLGNLLSNADKYSPPGAPIAVEVDERDGFLETSVTDAGPGIPADDVDHVFSPFFRSRQHSTFHGLGLGLTVCQRLVELQGGRINVRNLAAGGCRFEFSTPVADFEVE